MTSELDLLPVPGERDLPPGHLELRASALVAAIETAPEPGRLRRWVTSFTLLLATLAVACSVLLAGSARPHETAVAAKTGGVLAGGARAVALPLAPRPPQLLRL